MRRLAWVVVLLLAGVGASGVAAQSPSPTPFRVARDLCVTITAPQGGLTPDILMQGIRDGSITIDTVRTICQLGGPLPSSPAAAGDALPLEVGEFGFTVNRGEADYAQWAVIIRNPNLVDWMAVEMPVAIDFFDRDGNVLSTTEWSISLLPGQTAALADREPGAGDTRSMGVRVAHVHDQWVQTDLVYSEDIMDLTRVRTRMVDGRPVTTGRLTNNLYDMRFVPVAAVYRNSNGRVIGGAYQVIGFLRQGETGSFKLSGITTYRNLARRATEVYWQIGVSG